MKSMKAEASINGTPLLNDGSFFVTSLVSNVDGTMQFTFGRIDSLNAPAPGRAYILQGVDNSEWVNVVDFDGILVSFAYADVLATAMPPFIVTPVSGLLPETRELLVQTRHSLNNAVHLVGLRVGLDSFMQLVTQQQGWGEHLTTADGTTASQYPRVIFPEATKANAPRLMLHGCMINA